MEDWTITEDLPEVDYTEFNEEEIKEMNNYITNDISTPDSVLHDSNFHGQELSLDHGRTVMTASEDLEGLPMVILTPPASSDQLECRILQRMCHHMR